VREAIHQILDIELAIMLDTFREDLIAKIARPSGWRRIGQLAAASVTSSETRSASSSRRCS
jgi:hypothetical protein